MKLIYAIIGLLLLSCMPAIAQQFVITGNVTDDASGKGLPGIQVEAGTSKTLTGTDGTFRISGLKPDSYTLVISGDGFETVSLVIDLKKGSSDVGQIMLKSAQAQGESGIAEISLVDDDNSSEQTVSGVLHSTSDPYVSAASYSFSPMFFKMRGYDQEYQTVYMNGIPVNDAETGRAVWNEWGGLNDVTRNKQSVNGLEPSSFAFGNIGGTTNINSRPSMQRKQTKLSYSLANKSYNNRLMFTYSTGMMNNNWAITLSGSRRWSQEGYTEGTNYDAYSWFAGAEKKINSKHSIAFIAYASPYKRAQSAPATQEAYDLAGSNFYNPNWGMQEGEKRNARIRSAYEPMFMVNHYWNVNEKTKVTTSLAYSFGKMGTTGLNWYNANDPRPDYYRYLPSYQTDLAVKASIEELWKNDVSVSQVNWNRLYQVNYLSNLEGKQARYIVENNVTKQNQIFFTSTLTRSTCEHGILNAGIELTSFKGNHYKTLDDLLGGNFWVDIDQFAERDFSADSIKLQNDLNNPNRVIKEGDKFGYDYVLSQNSANLWAVHNWSYNRVDYYLGGSLNFSSISRDGKMRNGRNPENSYGKSDNLTFMGYNVKGGATYKITGRHYITLNGARLMVAPNLRDVYISPRTSNIETPDNSLETILSGDLSYVVRYPGINARITVYETYFQNHSEIMRYYHDDYRTYVNMVLSNQDRIHQGIEAGVLVKATSWMSVALAGSVGNFRYTNRPKATINFDNGSLPDTTETAYLNNFFVPGTPQVAGNAALKFNKNFWFFDVSVNYFDKIYLSFNPERRTQNAIENLGEGDPLITTITQQEKLDGGFTLDASLGKSIRYKSHFITLNLSVNNILNNTTLKSGGFEQLRFDFVDKNISKFPPKYFYSYGTTFFFNVGIRL